MITTRSLYVRTGDILTTKMLSARKPIGRDIREQRRHQGLRRRFKSRCKNLEETFTVILRCLHFQIRYQKAKEF